MKIHMESSIPGSVSMMTLPMLAGSSGSTQKQRRRLPQTESSGSVRQTQQIDL